MITNCPVALFFRNSDMAKEGRHQSILTRGQYTCNIQKKCHIHIYISLQDLVRIWLCQQLEGSGKGGRGVLT